MKGRVFGSDGTNIFQSVGKEWRPLANAGLPVDFDVRCMTGFGTDLVVGSAKGLGIYRIHPVPTKTWAAFNVGIPVWNGKLIPISALGVVGSRLFAGLGPTDSRHPAPSGVCVFTAADDRWTHRPVGLPTGFCPRWFAMHGDRVFVGMWNSGLFVENADNATWSSAGFDKPGDRAEDVNALASCGDRLYAGTTWQGLFVGATGIHDWVQARSAADWTVATIRHLVSRGNRIYVATSSPGIFGIHYRDGDQAWKEHNVGIVRGRKLVDSIQAFGIQEPQYDNTLYLSVDDRVYQSVPPP